MSPVLRRRADPDVFDWHDAIDGIGGLAGPANVIMQLSHPAVGYGVVESKVDSGKATLHPIKRARTTGTYLAVAAIGSPEQRQAFRKAVNTAHVQVRSETDSPVAYNAFDTSLQLWVAACLYRGLMDVQTMVRGPMSEKKADQVFREAARFGTTLQMRPEQWPADRAAFDAYWDQMERTTLALDDVVRRYLDDLVHLRHRPWPERRLLGPIVVFFTNGFLPPRFRELMQWPWSNAQQRRFEAWMRFFAVVNRLLPPALRRMPLNLYLIDLRVRMRFGWKMV